MVLGDAVSKLETFVWILRHISRSTQSEFLDVFYCGQVTYQIWARLETFKGNVNRTNTVNFDAHWTSGVKKGGFEISLATDM